MFVVGTIGGDRAMTTFGDLINTHRLILCCCDDCGSETPMDPSLSVRRFGRGADVDILREDAACPVCGSADVEFHTHSPASSTHEGRATPG